LKTGRNAAAVVRPTVPYAKAFKVADGPDPRDPEPDGVTARFERALIEARTDRGARHGRTPPGAHGCRRVVLESPATTLN
jgi:hypothetical protein